MATAGVYAATVNLENDRHIDRWRPFVQWILAIPHLVVVNALSSLRGILSLIGAVIVVFTGRNPRPLFDAITMTYRYEWRALSYAAFLTEDYPPFEFMPAAQDDGHQPNSVLAIAYPEQLNRWKPLYKWVLALPHYLVCVVLAIAGAVTVLGSAIAVVVTGTYPKSSQRFLVGAYRYGLRVQAYVGPLTDQYPPFNFAD